MHRTSALLAGALALATPAAAAAQPAVTPPSPAPLPVAPAGAVDAPDSAAFAQLDRGDGRSRIGIDVGWLHIEDSDLSEGVLHVDLYGQFVAPSGLGGYVVLPYNYLFSDPDSDGAVGNLEGGVLFVVPQSSSTEFVLRAGLTLPTASDNLFLVNLIGQFVRLTDLAHAEPKMLVGRVSGSVLGRSGAAFYRFDGGADVALASSSDAVDADHSPLLRVNGAVGFDAGTWTLAGEIVNLIFTDDEGGDFSDQLFTNAGVTLSAPAGMMRWHVGAYLSLDSILEDSSSQAVWMFLLGPSWTM